MIALSFKRSRVRCLTIPVPVKYLEMTPDISIGDGGVVFPPLLANSKFKEQKLSGDEKEQPMKTLSL